jgi:hypothetical protein
MPDSTYRGVYKWIELPAYYSPFPAGIKNVKVVGNFGLTTTPAAVKYAIVEWCLANSVRLVSIIDRVDTGRNSTAGEIARIHRLFVDAQEESELAKERSIDNISFLRENGVPWG